MTNAFDRLIVEVDASDFHVIVSGFFIDGKAVILGSDFHFPTVQVHDRLVAAMMTELEFVGCAAQCQVQDLMPQQMPNMGILPIRSRTFWMA